MDLLCNYTKHTCINPKIPCGCCEWLKKYTDHIQRIKEFNEVQGNCGVCHKPLAYEVTMSQEKAADLLKSKDMIDKITPLMDVLDTNMIDTAYQIIKVIRGETK